MFFNSSQFALFFLLVFILYWFVCGRSRKLQNYLLLVASYYFYSCWDWHFVFLLAFSTLLDYVMALSIYGSNSKQYRKMYLWISVCINLGFLGFFKYYDFFASQMADLLKSMGFIPDIVTLKIILPVGISFYTFHGLSYVFDIYNGKIKPTHNLLNYSLFVSFFPLLVAGPIERAMHLLPQMERVRTFKYSNAVDGMRQILWGLFKKIVIADTSADLVNKIFNNYHGYHGSTLLLGAILFAFQIYGDFSGYSDIALGTARLLGFDLLKNFNYPYFSRDIAEFWRRWHISLSSWFKDYLYFPLGGSRKGLKRTICNTFIIFVISGFWHGANWTFIIWGALNALLIVPSILIKTNRKHLDIVAKGKVFPSLLEATQMFVTFVLVSIAWVFFRSPTTTDAVHYIADIFNRHLFTIPPVISFSVYSFIVLFMLIEWFGRESDFAIQKLEKALKYRFLRWGFYLLLVLSITYNIKQGEPHFIYFQF